MNYFFHIIILKGKFKDIIEENLSFDLKYYVLKKKSIKYPHFQNNAQSNVFAPRKLSCHKTVIDNYGFTFLKTVKTVVINHGFNFKFKTVVDDYDFNFKFKIIVGDYGFNYF